MPQTQEYSLVPSIRGKIKLIVMVFDQSETSYIAILKELDKKLPAGAMILLLTKNELQRQTLIKETWSTRINLETKPNSGLSRWVRDPFIVFYEQDSGLLLNEFFKPRQNIANHIIIEQNEGSVLVEKADWFDAAGGNILTDQNNIFIGWNHFRMTMNRLYDKNNGRHIDDYFDYTKSEILNYINRGHSTYDKVIIIGEPAPEMKIVERSLSEKKKPTLFDVSLWKTSVQNMDDTTSDELTVHIDAFMSLTGQNSNGKPVIFVAFAVPGKPELAEKANKINKELNYVVEHLEEQFCVMRNPVPVVENHEYYTCFYNNCLVEVTESTKKVWIPSFAAGKEKWKRALAPFDKANQNLWKSLGFNAMLIYADFHNLCEQGNGALHCITNELIRN